MTTKMRQQEPHDTEMLKTSRPWNELQVQLMYTTKVTKTETNTAQKWRGLECGKDQGNGEHEEDNEQKDEDEDADKHKDDYEDV